MANICQWRNERHRTSLALHYLCKTVKVMNTVSKCHSQLIWGDVTLYSWQEHANLFSKANISQTCPFRPWNILLMSQDTVLFRKHVVSHYRTAIQTECHRGPLPQFPGHYQGKVGNTNAELTHKYTHTKSDALSKAGNGFGELGLPFSTGLLMPARGIKREPTLLTTHWECIWNDDPQHHVGVTTQQGAAW